MLQARVCNKEENRSKRESRSRREDFFEYITAAVMPHLPSEEDPDDENNESDSSESITHNPPARELPFGSDSENDEDDDDEDDGYGLKELPFTGSTWQSFTVEKMAMFSVGLSSSSRLKRLLFPLCTSELG